MSANWISIIFKLWMKSRRLLQIFIENIFYGLRFSLSLRHRDQSKWMAIFYHEEKNQTRRRIIIVTKEWSKYTKIMLYGSRRLLFGDAGAHTSTHTHWIKRAICAENSSLYCLTSSCFVETFHFPLIFIHFTIHCSHCL